MSEDASTNEKSPIEQAVDVLVYAPIGLLFEGSTILPQLVEKGRNQVTMARMIGKFAVQQGRVEATRTASKLGDQAAGLLDFLGDSLTPVQSEASPPGDGRGEERRARPKKRPTSTGRAAAAARTGAKVAAPARASSPGRPARKATATGTAARPPASDAPPASAADLAIPDYDGLSASHVVNRLAGLSPDELEAVRAYEAANRGRKTILNKIAQLQSA